MKKYTNDIQTAKLIEFGFEKPKGWCIEGISSNLIMYKRKTDDEGFNYSIGELIEMLPPYIKDNDEAVGVDEDYYSLTIRKNVVMYCDPYMDWVEILCDRHKDLIDNLYDMVTMLKEEGMI